MSNTDTEAAAWLNRLADDISVGTAPIGDVIRSGRRSRRRRTAATVFGSAVAVVAVVAATVSLQHVYERTPDNQDTSRVAQSLADYDSARMPQLMLDTSRDVFAGAYPDLPTGVFVANDTMFNPLPVDQYDKAAWMSVDYRATPTQALSVRLGHETDPSGESLTQQCERWTESGIYASCDVVTVEGQQAMDSIGPVTWVGDGPRPYQNLSGDRGTPRLRTMDEVPALDPNTVWFEHTVHLTHTGGYLTLVTESVQATSLTAAQALFRLDSTEMATLANDPDLVIPRAPAT